MLANCCVLRRYKYFRVCRYWKRIRLKVGTTLLFRIRPPHGGLFSNKREFSYASKCFIAYISLLVGEIQTVVFKTIYSRHIFPGQLMKDLRSSIPAIQSVHLFVKFTVVTIF